MAFEAAPKISEQAKQREAELDVRLETKVKGMVQCFSDYLIHFYNLNEVLKYGVPRSWL